MADIPSELTNNLHIVNNVNPPDVVIILDEKCNVVTVTPNTVHIQRGEEFTWMIVPIKPDGEQCPVTICFKDPTLIPFKDWPDPCIPNKGTNTISGQVKDFDGLQGTMEFHYMVIAGKTYIDPTICVH